MGNELIKINGTREINGKEIKVLEGGFGDGCKILTDKQIAEIHGIPVFKIRERINNNIKRFKADTDYKDLKGILDTDTLLELDYAKASITQAQNIYALSERGYSKLIKIMDSDLAWEIHDEIMDNYFTMREIINSDEQLKANLLLKIYSGGQDGILASKELAKIEIKEATKPLIIEIGSLNETIEEMTPKVTYVDTILKSIDTVTVTQIAKDYGISAVKLNKILHENNIQYKIREQWVLYSKYQNEGYTKSNTYDIIHKNGEAGTAMSTKWTQKGRLFIHKLLVKLGYIAIMDKE